MGSSFPLLMKAGPKVRVSIKNKAIEEELRRNLEEWAQQSNLPPFLQ